MTPTRTYRLIAAVRWTRFLLVAQLIAAALATVATGFVISELGPLIAERDQIRDEILSARAEVTRVQKEKTNMLEELAETKTRASQLDEDIRQLSEKLQNARRTTRFVSRAIVSYHSKEYARAIVFYDAALKLDPSNPWILDLKSYSQFRDNDIDGAIASINYALELEPAYLYGYSELSRYQCAAGDYEGATQTLRRAIELHGYPAAELYTSLLKTDGQFKNLCSAARSQFEAIISAQETDG